MVKPNTITNPGPTITLNRNPTLTDERFPLFVDWSFPGEALHTVVHAFIASRVDCCNALLYGVADGIIRRLQSVLHAAAQLITDTDTA